MPCATVPGTPGNEQQLEQFFVRPVQAAVEHHSLGQHGGQAQAQFVVGEAVTLDGRRAQTHRPGEAQRLVGFVVEMQQQGLFVPHFAKTTRALAARGAQEFTP